jgi:short-subunit dehydrogenase
MKLAGARILLTGAAGGIGAAVAEGLAARGARLALVDRNAEALDRLQAKLSAGGGTCHVVPADLLDAAARNGAVEQAADALGGIDILINNAGLLSFRPFDEEDPVQLERIIQLNLLTPMLLTRQVLPLLKAGGGRIVNIGSTFGTIGFAWFTAYSASKFGLRGFSEALRRELDGSGVGVTYIAPRAVKTRLNTGAVYRMAEATGMNMDAPEWVAAQVVSAIEADRKDIYLGFPEKLFARINGVFPRLVDAALRKQNRVMEGFARES